MTGKNRNLTSTPHLVRTIARSMADAAIEAQACYCLGATNSLMNRHRDAIKFYLEHLHIAQRLTDRVGESRAYWALGNAHKHLGNKDRAAFYTKRHLEIRFAKLKATVCSSFPDLVRRCNFYFNTNSVSRNIVCRMRYR